MSDDPPAVAYLQAGIEDADSALVHIESPLASDEDSMISAAVDYVEESDHWNHADWTGGWYLVPNDE